MNAETIRPGEKGSRFIQALQNPDNLLPIPDPADPSFVRMPDVLTKLYPESSIPPRDFLRALGLTDAKEIDTAVESLTGDRIGIAGHPVFQMGEEGFQLQIMNGLTNYHALELSCFAHTHLAELPEKRALYQYHLNEMSKASLQLHQNGKWDICIHDDCLATGDSVAGWLVANQAAIAGRDVRVMIDGAATAQGILFLQAFARKMNINLELIVSHLATGLSERNYITYPTDLLKELGGLGVALGQLRSSDGEIYVVGDMGDAIQGINDEIMQELRKKYGSKFCTWNDLRSDDHGDHPNKLEQLRLEPAAAGEKRMMAYLARGGYFALVRDSMVNRENDFRPLIRVDRASREHREEAFGAIFHTLAQNF